jgi:hypothetical protein
MCLHTHTHKNKEKNQDSKGGSQLETLFICLRCYEELKEEMQKWTQERN